MKKIFFSLLLISIFSIFNFAKAESSCYLENQCISIKCGLNQSKVNNICKCNKGYHWDDFGNECVSNVQCPANSIDINYECICINGYEFNQDHTKCLDMSQKENILDLEKRLTTKIDNNFTSSLSGYFVMQKESENKIWYISKDKKRYYIQNGKDLEVIIKKENSIIFNGWFNYYLKTKFPEKYIGKFITNYSTKNLYYLNPENKKLLLLTKDYKKDFETIKNISKQISNTDIRKIKVGD